MTNQSQSHDLTRLLQIDQQHIQETYPYVYYVSSSAPHSDTPWPKNTLPYDLAELHARLVKSNQLPLQNPYEEHDAWLHAHCGPKGHDRVGGIIGIRDRTVAEAFLRWLFPTLNNQGNAAERDLKLHLVRMMVKKVPNTECTDRLLRVFRDDAVAVLKPEQLASTIDDIFIMKEQDDDHELLADESEALALNIMGLMPRVQQETQAE